MDYVPSAIFELARMNPVQRVILGRFSCPNVCVYGSQSGIGRNSVQPDASGFDCGFRVSEVDKCS